MADDDSSVKTVGGQGSTTSLQDDIRIALTALKNFVSSERGSLILIYVAALFLGAVLGDFIGAPVARAVVHVFNIAVAVLDTVFDLTAIVVYWSLILLGPVSAMIGAPFVIDTVLKSDKPIYVKVIYSICAGILLFECFIALVVMFTHG